MIKFILIAAFLLQDNKSLSKVDKLELKSAVLEIQNTELQIELLNKRKETLVKDFSIKIDSLYVERGITKDKYILNFEKMEFIPVEQK